MSRKRIAASVVAGIACLVLVSQSFAVITGRLPLKDVLADNEFIFVAKVEKLYPEKPAMILSVVEELKGKMPVRKLPVNLGARRDGKKDLPVLLKRVAVDLPVLLFVKQRADEEVWETFLFTNGSWFHLLGQKREDGSSTWSFLNGEPYLRRTFKGTTAELRQVVIDALSGKKEPPAPNDNEPKGYGPEVESKKGAAAPSGRAAEVFSAAVRRDEPGRSPRVLFGVIPTLGVGGPLAILAILFPSVFGGVLLLFRRWLAFFTVISVISLAYLLHWVFHDSLRGTWWGSDDALWYSVMGITFLGALWAWTRYLTWASDPALPSPGRAELVVLWIMSLSCAGIIGLYAAFWDFPSHLDVAWGLFLTFTLGIWLATLYKTYRAVVGLRRIAPELSIEGLILWGALIGFAGLAAERGGLGRGADTSGSVSSGDAKAGDGVLHPAEFVRTVWEFRSPERGGFVSSATLHADYVFIAAAHPTIKKGTLYCLDRRTGQKVTSFIDGGEFMQPYSSPFIADGHLYIGEGFHTDPDCKLYCLDLRDLAQQDPAKRKLRVANRFTTTSQTESSPVVASGKVYFGAGNDGFYCVEAVTLQERWRFPKDPTKGRLLRFGGSAAVHDKRVYVGTGVDREQKEDKGETAIFCLDADSGELIWKIPTDLPAWGAPVVVDDRLYYGIGNGDVVTDALDATPAGAMLCLDAKTGKQLWRVDVPNGILERPAVDRHHVYFGCRDGYVYCLSRFSGKERWKTDLGSAIVTAPALAKCSDCEATAAVYVIATAGKVCCLDPGTGRVQWTFNLEGRSAHLASSPRVEVVPTADGDRRRIYFGAALGAGPNLTGQAVVYCLEDRVCER